MKYKTNAYLITALTHMHVGSGGANYGVVDNLVQRDPVTNMPVIHASSLKGALREFFVHHWDTENNSQEKKKLNYIFGPDSSRDNSSGEEGIGHYKFFAADLLAMPIRSDKKPYYMATAPMLVDTINQKAKAFGFNNLITGNLGSNGVRIKNGLQETYLEDWEATVDTNISLDAGIFGENIAVLDDDKFKIFAKRLPVIARNKLEHGESKNLWYEEIVPHQSRFVFFVSIPLENGDGKHEKEFEDAILNNIVQIGGNASIGYGYCEITKMS